LAKKRDFILNDDVSASSIKDIIMGILEINRYDEEQLEKNEKYVRRPINLIVNTYGGSIYDGFALVSVMDTSKTPVHTYCYGKAMSMGFLIFAIGHKRFAHPLATFMYHNGAVGMHDDYKGLEYGLEQGKSIVAMGDRYITSITNITQEKLDHYKERRQNWYMFAEEAFEYGLVDELLTSARQVQ
jgi:ATP-dependent Clp protease protease subunit